MLEIMYEFTKCLICFVAGMIFAFSFHSYAHAQTRGEQWNNYNQSLNAALSARITAQSAASEGYSPNPAVAFGQEMQYQLDTRQQQDYQKELAEIQRHIDITVRQPEPVNPYEYGSIVLPIPAKPMPEVIPVLPPMAKKR